MEGPRRARTVRAGREGSGGAVLEGFRERLRVREPRRIRSGRRRPETRIRAGAGVQPPRLARGGGHAPAAAGREGDRVPLLRGEPVPPRPVAAPAPAGLRGSPSGRGHPLRCPRRRQRARHLPAAERLPRQPCGKAQCRPARRPGGDTAPARRAREALFRNDPARVAVLPPGRSAAAGPGRVRLSRPRTVDCGAGPGLAGTQAPGFRRGRAAGRRPPGVGRRLAAFGSPAESRGADPGLRSGVPRLLRGRPRSPAA